MLGAKYDFSSDHFFADPFEMYARMRVEDPVYWHPLLSMWIVTRYSDVRFLSRDPRLTAERVDAFFQGISQAQADKIPVVRDFFAAWMVLMDPPAHTRIRSLINRAFSPRAISKLTTEVEGIVESTLDKLPTGQEIDLIQTFAFPVPSNAIAVMLGIPPADMKAFEGWARDAFRVITLIGDPDENVAVAHGAVMQLEEYLRQKILECRTSPRDDILSGLVHASESGDSLTERELVATCAMLLNAAHATTAHLIGNAVLLLLTHPAELDKLKKSPQLIDQCIEEVLRYDGAAPGILRAAKEDMVIGEQRVPAGQLLLGMTHAANRDPDVFDDPETFDIERGDASRHIAFGHGPHVCLGAALARMETQIAVGRLVARFPDLHMTTDVSELGWLHSLAVRGVTSLPVVL